MHRKDSAALYSMAVADITNQSQHPFHLKPGFSLRNLLKMIVQTAITHQVQHNMC